MLVFTWGLRNVLTMRGIKTGHWDVDVVSGGAINQWSFGQTTAVALLLGPIFTLASKLLGQGPKAESSVALSSQDQAHDCQCSKAGAEAAEPGSHSDCQQTSYNPDTRSDCDSTEREPE